MGALAAVPLIKAVIRVVRRRREADWLNIRQVTDGVKKVRERGWSLCEAARALGVKKEGDCAVRRFRRTSVCP